MYNHESAQVKYTVALLLGEMKLRKQMNLHQALFSKELF